MEHDIDIMGYIDGSLTAGQATEVKKHLDQCLACRKIYEEIKESDEFITEMIHRYPQGFCPDNEQLFLLATGDPQADELAYIKRHLEVCVSCRHNYEQIVATDGIEVEMPDEKDLPPLPKQLRKYVVKAASKRKEGGAVVELSSSRLVSLEETAADDHLDFVKMAAATNDRRDEKPSTVTGEGRVVGVWVPATGGGRGCLLRITAGVRENDQGKGELSINVTQNERGRGRVTLPKDKLEKAVADRLKMVACLDALKFYKKTVKIEIDQIPPGEAIKSVVVGYLDGSESLILPIIVAIVKAAQGLENDDGYVFSAQVSISGRLEEIAFVQEKTDLASKAGRVIVLPPVAVKNGKKIDTRGLLQAAGADEQRYLIFEKLDSLLKTLFGLDSLKQDTVEKPNLKSTSTYRPHAGAPLDSDSRFLCAFHIASALLLLAFGVGAFLSKDFFFLDHLLIARHLNTHASGLFDWINLAYIVIIVCSPIEFAAIRRRFLSKRNQPALSWMAKTALISSVLFWLFLCVNAAAYMNNLFEALQPAQRYAKIRHLLPLKDTSFFSFFLQGVPDIPFQEFQKADDPSAIEWGLQIELAASSPNDIKKAAFIFNKMAHIVAAESIRKSKSIKIPDKTAREIVLHYLYYTAALDKKSEYVQKFVFDTILSYDQLIGTADKGGYDLKGHRPEERPGQLPEGLSVGAYFDLIKKAYGVKHHEN